MALFAGDELVDVPTPDGRILKLPRSIVPASVLQQNLAASPVPVTDEVAGGPGAPAAPPPPAPVPSVTGGALPTEDTQAAPAPAAPPDYVAGTAPDYVKNPGELAKANKTYDKQQAAQAAYAASPAGQIGAAAEGQQKAIGQEKEAVVKQADVDAAGQLLVADAYQKRNQELDNLFAQRAKEANDNLIEQDKKAAELETMRKKIASTKIDRSADHPILAAIGVALAGLGSALQHRYDGQSPDVQTPLNLVFKAIQQKVAGQMADLEQQKDVLGLTRAELATLKDKASSRLAMTNLLISAATDKAANQVQEIAARTGSEKVKASALQMVAQLQQKAADAKMGAVQSQLAYDQRERFQRQDIGYKYSALGEQAREANQENKYKYAALDEDMAKALAAENARGGAESMKQLYEMDQNNKKLGVWNIDTKEPLLRQAGVDKMKKADALEKQADDLEVNAGRSGKTLTPEDQAKVQQLRDQAGALRGDARLRDAFTFGDPVETQKARNEYAAAQQIVTMADDIKLLYDKEGRSYFDTSGGRAAIQAKEQELMMQLKTAWQLGVLSKQDMAAIDKATGGDPSSGWTVGNIMSAVGIKAGEDPEAFKSRLEVLAKDTAQSIRDKYAASGLDVKDPLDMFAHKTAPPGQTPEEKASEGLTKEPTPGEVAATAEERNTGAKGYVYRAAYAAQPLLAKAPTSPADEAAAAEASGSLKYPGLNDEQGKIFGNLLNDYQSGNAAAGATLVRRASTERPALALALMHNLRDNNMDLYIKARSAMNPNSPVAKQLDAEEKNTIGAASRKTEQLIIEVNTTGDQAGKTELVRRATVDKDPVAKQWLMQNVLNQRGTK